MRAEREAFAAFRAMGDAPKVPMLVLLAGNAPSMPPGPAFPGSFEKFTRALASQRLDHFSQMVTQSSNGTLVLVGASGHFIQSSDSESVVWAVRRFLKRVGPEKSP